MDEYILKNILQPLRFFSDGIEEAKLLYNNEILNKKLTRESHIRLHGIFQRILDKLKVLTDRLRNLYENKLIWAIANGYSHTKNFRFEYYYKGGESICDCCDAPPIYI